MRYASRLFGFEASSEWTICTKRLMGKEAQVTELWQPGRFLRQNPERIVCEIFAYSSEMNMFNSLIFETLVSSSCGGGGVIR
jgi:hypothetical protein